MEETFEYQEKASYVDVRCPHCGTKLFAVTDNLTIKHKIKTVCHECGSQVTYPADKPYGRRAKNTIVSE